MARFYIGVTNDLIRRIGEHKLKVAKSFTKKYEVTRLVYFKIFDQIEHAARKAAQEMARAWKISLIEKQNPDWIDLYPEIARGGG